MKMMKMISYVLGAAGTLLFVYAVIGRFVGDATVFGFIRATQTQTVVIGANTILLLAVLAALCGMESKSEQR